ncbi:MAG: hypothetical protein ACRDKT_08180 [Actinomycetota bacterium]
MLRRHRLWLLVALVLLIAACGDQGGDGGDGGAPGTDEGGEEIVVQAANYDLSVGDESRFIAGVLTHDQLFVSYGSVDMKFFYLGTERGSGKAEEGPTATGRFLTIEGDPSTEGPVAGPASEGRGVYAADVTFDRAGFWAVELTAELEGEPKTGQAVFEVREESLYPAVGEAAPRSKNLTLPSKAPERAVDSRAETTGIPDEILHRTTIKGSIEAGEPAVVVFSTPVYCVSRFCGPITDTVAELARDYSGRANFIHVEVWWNFEKQVVNRTAGEWIFVKNDLTEPWIFLIGADGKIVQRWDNVATREEIEPFLKKLPAG